MMAENFELAEQTVSHTRRSVALDLAVRDWLETQARVAGYWRDLLVEQNGDVDLIAALDKHEAFLLLARP